MLGLLVLVAGCYQQHGTVLGADASIPPSAVTMPCSGGGGGSSRDCGWRVETSRTCTPGARLRAGCGCEGLGSCTGDPMIRVCSGFLACSSAAALVSVDDSCGLCPVANFVCPPEGRIAVLTAPFSAGGTYSCTVEVD